MSCFLAFCLILVTAAAQAGQFPVKAAYGTAVACAAFADGGIEAVDAGQDVSALLVTPDDLAAPGLRCPGDKAEIKGAQVKTVCTLGEDEPFTLAAVIEENDADRTVKYSSATGTIILRRCS
jgi:hypothetical protein